MRKLEQFLKQEDPNLFHSYEKIREASAEIWEDVKLPWFTDHSTKHSSRLVGILDKILEPLYENKNRYLSTTEAFILLCSCYLHDIGMQDLRIDNLSADKLTDIQYEAIRAKHAERSSELVKEGLLLKDGVKSINLNLEGNGEWARALMPICKSHSTAYFDEVVSSIEKKPPVIDNNDLRGDLLCALLMIADELDLNRSRVNFNDAKLIGLPLRSQLHWYTHHYINKCDVSDQRIKIDFLVPTDWGDERAEILKRRVMDKLMPQIDLCNPIMERNTGGILSLKLDHPTHEFDIANTIIWEMPDEVFELRNQDPKADVTCIPPVGMPPIFLYEAKSPVRLFTGRAKEIVELTKMVEDCRVCMIMGIGGTGKTELVAKYISGQTRYDDKSVFWFDIHQGHTADDIAVALGKEEMLKSEKMTAQNKGVNLSYAIDQRPNLIVIDNIQETSDDAIEYLLRHACSHLRNSKIILVGKAKSKMIARMEPELRVSEIEGLDEDGLQYAMRLRDEDKVCVSDDDLRSICDEVRNHPLAIEISLSILQLGGDSEDLIRNIIHYSKLYESEDLINRLLSELHRHASPSQCDLAYRLSVFRRPIPDTALAFIYADGNSKVDLWGLKNGLMLHYENKSYSMHPLVAAACYNELEDKVDAHNHAAEFYCSLRTDIPEIGVESEIIHHLICAGRSDDARKILGDHGEDFLIQGHVTALSAILTEVHSNDGFTPQLHLLKGKLFNYTSRYDEARIEFANAERDGDPPIACESRYWLSMDLLRKGLTHDARSLAEDGLSIAEAMDDQRLIAHFLNAAGQIAKHQGRTQEALDFHRRSYSILAAMPCPKRAYIASALGNIGIVYDSQGRYEEALEKHEQSLSIAREIGNRAGETASLGNIGSVYYSQGRYEEALEKHEQSLNIKRGIGDRAGEATSLGNIGIVYDSQGRYEEALERHEQCLSIKREIGDRAEEATSLCNIGCVYYSQSKYEEALEKYEQGLGIAREIGDRAGEATSLSNIGNIYHAQDKCEEALEKHEQSLSIKREIGNRAGEATSLGNIGTVYYSQSRYKEALEKHEQSLSIKREIGDQEGEAATLNNVSYVYHAQGEYQLSIDFLLESEALCRHLALPHRIADIISGAMKFRKEIGFSRFRKLINNSYDRLPDELKPYSGYAELIADGTTRSIPNKIGRNDLCPCGSRKKFKNCCME